VSTSARWIPACPKPHYREAITRGKAEFTVEFGKYGKVPQSVSEILIKEFEEKRK
jgi:hypothetical protein